MKRFVTTCSAVGTSAATAHQTVTLTDDIFPPIANPMTATASSFNQQDLWSYMRYAYVGLRGSVKKRIRMCNIAPPSGAQTIEGVIITLLGESSSEVGTPTVTFAANGPTTLITTLEGSSVFVPINNAGVEVDFPFYSKNLFHFSFADNFVGTNPGGTGNMDTAWTRSFTLKTAGSWNAGVVRFWVDCAAGEDFTFLRFQGAPVYMRA